MPEALTLSAFNHVSLTTKKLEESRRFYVEVMGGREISRPAFGFPGAWIYLAGIQIHLIENFSAVEPAPGINSRENHIAFATPDIDEMERRLQRNGMEYRRSLIKDRNIPQLYFCDPDGHLIEVGMYGIIDQ
jgi:catechol 2,3-dioxygenase-like lactoylglutathione lyase family enzyme